MLIGVISDTHGLLRPEVFRAFSNVELILHGGDIGSEEVLEGLQTIAPVVAVRGNNDTAGWAKSIPDTNETQAGRRRIFLIHDLKEMNLNPLTAGFHVVISGHSHKPRIDQHDGVLFVNPGSAGPRRFKLPVTVARLDIKGTRVKAELAELIRIQL